MKITLFEVPPAARQSFSVLQKYHDIEVQFVEDPLTEVNVDKYLDTEILSTFIYSTLDAKVLSKLNKLKLITTRSTGFDHIDSGFCKKQDILVCNVPNYAESTVGEYIFALILNISRKIFDTISRTRNGNFSRENLNGFDLNGKTIGIVGLGSIGNHTAQIANAFGMRVIAHDIIEKPDLAKRMHFKYKSLEDLVRESDIISLNVPGTPATKNMIAQKEFSIMKNGVVLINTARGNVINLKSLITALKQGKVAGAALDVLPEETTFYKNPISTAPELEKNDVLSEEEILLKMPNVYITPHNAFNTKEALERINETANTNIISFLKGKPKNLVNFNH